MSMNQKKVKNMTMNDDELKKAQETQYLLNQTKKAEQNKPTYWLWSDIASIHSDILNPDYLIPVDYFHEKLHHNVSKVIPEFRNIFPKPIHVKSISNQTLNETDSPDMEKNLDQQITGLGCEFFCQKFYNTEFSQAYFLFPNASFRELVHYADEICLYRTSKKIQNMTRIFFALVADMCGQTNKKENFDYLLNIIWTELFNVNDIQILKNKYKIANSPTTHLMPNQWIYIYYMLQDIVNNVSPHTYLTIGEIAKQCRESACFQRSSFIKHTEQAPEDFLTPTNFKETVTKIETARKDFWLANYQKSLR